MANTELNALMKDLHRECKAQGVREPSELSNITDYIGDFFEASPDHLSDYLNCGEIPELEELVPNLFDARLADPMLLAETIKRRMRQVAIEGMDARYANAVTEGLFAWDDAA